jgi:hypothetical protein
MSHIFASLDLFLYFNTCPTYISQMGRRAGINNCMVFDFLRHYKPQLVKETNICHPERSEGPFITFRAIQDPSPHSG